VPRFRGYLSVAEHFDLLAPIAIESRAAVSATTTKANDNTNSRAVRECARPCFAHSDALTD
jgi:hypothetical protein